MIAIIKRIFKRKPETQTDFSKFFYDAPARDKKKLLMEVIREANNDQRAIIDQYNKTKAA